MRLRPVRLISAGLLALSTVSLTSCDDANAAAGGACTGTDG